MDFLQLVTKRYSVRKYADRKVEPDKIARCIEAARLAPSACNSQPWKFVIIDEPELKTKVAKAAFEKIISINRFIFEAPVLVLLISQPQKLSAKLCGIVKRRDFRLMDIGIAAEHFCLAAAEQGLGTCMLGWFNERPVRKLLSIPKGKRIELVITAGYPDTDKIPAKNRKTTGQITSYNKF
ncbi:MAG: nitroreductase family protein [Sedimentisphaerales bacterium]|nr:nitroreductase family protein [Sedimentisphaerales bacterium]